MGNEEAGLLVVLPGLKQLTLEPGCLLYTSQWVADLLAISYDDAYKQRGDADWLTGKEVYDGIADGTVEGYYQLQQDIMLENPESGVTEAVPVENYVAFNIMTEAGDALYGEAAAE